MTLDHLNQFVFSPFIEDNSSLLAYYEAKGLDLENINETLKDLCKKYSDLAIKTYIDIFGLENISGFEDSYIGEFASEDDISESFQGEYVYDEEFAFAI